MSSPVRERLYATVSALVPCAFLAWPVGGAPSLPWAVYSDEPDGLGADNGNWAARHRIEVGLYEKEIDTDLGDSLFEALAAEYGYVSPPETVFIDSESCYRTLFRVADVERIG